MIAITLTEGLSSYLANDLRHGGRIVIGTFGLNCGQFQRAASSLDFWSQ